MEQNEHEVIRRRLPDTRPSFTHKFNVAGHEGCIIVGMYDDGSPGELFIHMSKGGSTISGLMNTIGILTSLSLQHGVPLESIVNKLSGISFEPFGFTETKEIKIAKSIIDYIYRWLGLKFIKGDKHAIDDRNI